MRQWIRNDKGNVLIMVALGFAVLAGFGILTIDVGRMLVTKSQLQNAADAAALAGASLYCSGMPSEAEVRDEARLIASGNDALETTAVPVVLDNGDILIEHSATGHDVTANTFSNTRQHLLGLFAVFKNSDPNAPPNVAGPRDAAVKATATARCGATCSVSCVKPWSIPDRWDDVTGIPGYMGEQVGRQRNPDWRGDNHWGHEELTGDTNGNGLYDLGETYVDANGNGQYDQEAYHSSLTGYGPDPIPGNFLSPNGDLGLELVLHAGSPADAPEPGQYWSIDLPPINKGTPIPGADEYRENIARCNPASIEKGDWLQTEPGLMVGPTNQGMRDLIAQDPDASWDDATQRVVGSNFGVSPRIVLIPIHDPRIPISNGRTDLVQVTKVAAFFMEQMTGPAEVRGRFLKVRAPGAPCVDGQNSGFFTYNLSLIR